MDRKPYKVKELADRWSCSQETVYARIRSGELSAFTIGGKLYRVLASEVERWESGGGSTQSASSGSGHSGTDKAGLKPSSAGGTSTERNTDADLASSTKQKVDNRLTVSLAASRH